MAMHQPADCDIAVVGGGLAGLVAALTLAGLGRSVVLFAPPRPPDRRTTAILGDSVDALRAVGVWSDLEAQSAPLRAIRVVDATGRLGRAPEVRFDAEELGLEAFGYNVPNEAMLAALDVAVARSAVRHVVSAVSGFEPAVDGLRLTGANGVRITARLVVGADGRGSPTRSAAGIALRSRTRRQAALVADFRHELPHDDTSTEFHTTHGPFTLVPLPGRRSALVWVNETAEAERIAALPAEALAETVEAKASSILGAMTLDGRAQVIALSSAAAARYAADRVVLIGEAAHVVPPIAAQGFNLAIGDIRTLAALIETAGPDSAAVADSYDRRRRSAVSLRAGAVDVLNWSLLTGLPPVHAVRGLGLLAVARMPGLRRLVMRQGLGSGTAPPTEMDRPGASRS